MEKISKSKSSSSDHADRYRQSETRNNSSDTLPQSARARNLIATGQNPHQWSEQASTSRASDSDQEKQPLLHEKQEIKERVQPKDTSLNNIKTDIIERYKSRAGTTCQTLRTVHNLIGKACLKDGQYEEALFSYEIARALDSQTARKGYDSCLPAAIRTREARHQDEEQGVQQEEVLLSRIEQSIVNGYKKHLKSDEDTKEIKDVLNEIGEYHREHGQYKEALFFYNTALALKKNSKTAPLGRGAIYRKQGRLNEALADLNKASQQFFFRPSTFTLANRGATYYELRQLDKALPDLNQALKKHPDNLLALAHRGATLLELGQPDKALTDLNQALERDPNNSFALAHRGAALRELGQPDKALPDLNQALERDPNNSFATETRAKAHQERHA